MKIVQIIDTLRGGGKERQLVELIKAHRNNPNITHTVVTLSEDIHYLDICNLDIEIYKFIRRSKKDLRIFRSLYQLCRQNKPDIIHSWESMCSIYAFPICKLLGIKLVNGFLRDAPRKLGMSPLFRSKLTFPFSDAIVSNSYAGLRSYHAPQKRAICIHNGFDFNRLDNLKDRKAVRQQFNIRTKHVVGMVATFSEKKDYKTFIQAAIEVLNTKHDVTFIAVGDGPTLVSCKSMVPKKFRDQIKFLGKQERIEDIVNMFDVGVLTTYTEGLSNSILEYMALEKPVIATRCDGNEELIEDGKTGVLVSTESQEELTRAIEELLRQPSAKKDMGLRAKEKVMDAFSIERYAQQYMSIYRSLVDK